MGARFPFVGILSICLISGSAGARAEDAPGTVEVLPTIEVTAPRTSTKPGHARLHSKVVAVDRA